MFKEHYEKDLAAAYTRQVKKINFRFGYAQRSNLQLAQKNQAQ
jgi:hypothetical protein